MTTSNWEESRARSEYHFDNFKIDPRYDGVTTLGHLKPTWASDLQDILVNSRPATWATRGYKGQDVQAPSEELAKEEYDLEQTGYGKDYVITHLNWTIPESLQRISDAFALDDCMNRIHVQMPGEVWNLHIDKLYKWNPEDPGKVLRVFIALTDWEQGHFWSYGNYMYSGWRAGDVTTFDWANVPHSTANAGHRPRATFQLTGVKTPDTRKFLTRLKNSTSLAV
jgi:hypothetical protein